MLKHEWKVVSVEAEKLAAELSKLESQGWEIFSISSTALPISMNELVQGFHSLQIKVISSIVVRKPEVISNAGKDS